MLPPAELGSHNRVSFTSSSWWAHNMQCLLTWDKRASCTLHHSNSEFGPSSCTSNNIGHNLQVIMCRTWKNRGRASLWCEPRLSIQLKFHQMRNLCDWFYSTRAEGMNSCRACKKAHLQRWSHWKNSFSKYIVEAIENHLQTPVSQCSPRSQVFSDKNMLSLSILYWAKESWPNWKWHHNLAESWWYNISYDVSNSHH